MKRIIYYIALAMLVLTSCDKEDSKSEIVIKADLKTINSNIDLLSSLIAKASGENVNLRKFIKEEVGKKFDYDYDALLITFIGKNIAGEKFEDILASHSSGNYTSSQIVSIIKSSGYIQVSIPVHYDEFNPITDKPLTVVIPVDINEKTIDNFNAYKPEGGITTISAKNDPNEAVFVIMESERVDDNGKLTVDENGFFIEDKTNRVHYSKVKSQINNKQQMKSTDEKIINIISDDDFEKRMAFCTKEESKQIQRQAQSKRILSSTTSYLGTLLNVQAKAVQEITLNWLPLSNSNTYEIYRTGPVNIDGVKTSKEDMLIYNLTNTLTKTDKVDYANEEYEYYIKYFDGNTYLGQPYPASAHSSHRKNNGLEYIKKITVSSSTVIRLEGWWVSELEIRCQYAYLNYDSVLVANKDVIPVIPTSGSGATGRYVDWFYGSSRTPVGTGNLFTWDRVGYRYGAYNLILEEWDASDQKQEKMDLLFDWVRFGLKLAGASEVWGELATQVKKTITILDKPDYMGSVNVKWWDPNDYIRTVGAGCLITINHNSNNN